MEFMLAQSNMPITYQARFYLQPNSYLKTGKSNVSGK